MKAVLIFLTGYLVSLAASSAENTIDMECKLYERGHALHENYIPVRLENRQTLVLGKVGEYIVSLGRFNGPFVTVTFQSGVQAFTGMYDWSSAIDTSINTASGSIALGCNSLK